MRKWLRSFPYQYHLRSLFRRRASTSLNLLAIFVTVLVFLIMNGMAMGLRQSLQSTGRDNTVVLLTKGSESAEVSQIPTPFFSILRYFPEIALRADSSPLFSQEIYTVKPLRTLQGGSPRWFPIRGMDPKGFDLYQELLTLEGRPFAKSGEILVGNLVKTKMGKVKIGDSLPIGRQRYRIVGIFSANGSAFESEIWMPRSDFRANFNISYDSIGVAQFNSTAERDAFIARAVNDPRMELDAKTEKEYFSTLARSANMLQILSSIIAFVLSIAAVFTGMNALYASISSRKTEIGTLRSLGFGRRAILIGFLCEGIAIALLAGLSATLLSLPFEKIPISFLRSSFRIKIPFLLMLQGVLISWVVGLIGSWIPARQAARLKIVTALK